MGLKESAWLSVQLMANDMATTGVAPMYAQFVLNLPPQLSSDDFAVYWKYIHVFCEDLGIAITGGHTGRFEGQQSTVAGGGTMIAVAPEGSFLTSVNATPGNSIIVTKTSALIATSVLSRSFPQYVSAQLGPEVQQQAAALFYETSAVQAGITAAGLNTRQKKMVRAMHDVTEGGILGAVYEMAVASGCGVFLNKDTVPVGNVQQQVCDLFAIDPLFSIGAGAMIMAVEQGSENCVIEALKKTGIQATTIGTFVHREQGYYMYSGGRQQELKHPGTDPYWKAFYMAYAKGLQ
jgi:hydrogenase maturation factor